MLKWISYHLLTMDKHEKENWAKIKEALEKAKKTDCFFYERAVKIVDGKPDPLK